MRGVNPEALACAKVLTRVALADGYLKDSERIAIAEAAKAIELPGQLDLETLVVEEDSLEQLLAEITSPEVRSAVYRYASEIASLDGQTSTEEQALLDKIKAAYQLS
ncbi:TerB family tellurite resistance protein [Gloeobacter kilaueensis]|uniref:Co-chaperone DjlA N-terminal domain-containing protein n=1 Tax=Gloeobacter kilaueensis (strain ATCC BAA-2537 / CCAP 1431/1 / ULC 316 / JS1) TaxID=1183438 RepID=U5QMC8_GLOK1|nr:TerB family tellurite resistance protein [Gloeobacter kilaueensis]AGY60152.1 hypothetical protein GKIL_3906 [Gloeobacter kilaueensis JS1]